MRAKNLGIFSVVFASICCLGPLILVLVGLGSLGIGTAIGRYHWWFLGGGILLIIIAWSYYFKEKNACELKACQMENKRPTQIILTLATLIVALFVGLDLYTYLSKSIEKTPANLIVNSKEVIIAVEGMTCFTCEVTVTQALKKVDRVISANVSAKEKIAKVRYNPDKTDIGKLIEAINETGYKADIP